MPTPTSPVLYNTLKKQSHTQLLFKIHRRHNSTMGPDRTSLFLEILLAIIIPPLGVFFRHGCCSVEFCICLLLTFLGYIPGIIYAVYAILVIDREDRTDYYYVNN